MQARDYNLDHVENAWCPGCGNFPILQSLKQALAELDIKSKKLVVTSGIGQAAKLPHYIKANAFNGLHGRALPVSSGIKAINPQLTVICCSGDGDIYGEGGNHFIHSLRRNSDITCIVHNNMVYGLTKGQASPTSMLGFKTPTQPQGVITPPFNPIAISIAMGTAFVARANAGDIVQTKEIMKKAIHHKGFSLIDVFQPCVVFNKVNTYQWFKEYCYYLDKKYDSKNREKALKVAFDEEKLALGVIYENPDRTPFEDKWDVYAKSKSPLWKRKLDMKKLRKIADGYRF